MKNKLIKIQNVKYDFEKIGIDEVVGLKSAMKDLMKPIAASIQDKAYWLEDSEILGESEYRSRDGFIPYSDNCGGIEITQVIPESEAYEFSFLEFGEWDGEHCCDKTDIDNCECAGAWDGEYDAKLRIWFKFEGIDDEGNMNFYLYLGGGNGDAPYFRTSYENDIFEASFSCKSVAGLKRAASKHFKALAKVIK